MRPAASFNDLSANLLDPDLSDRAEFPTAPVATSGPFEAVLSSSTESLSQHQVSAPENGHAPIFGNEVSDTATTGELSPDSVDTADGFTNGELNAENQTESAAQHHLGAHFDLSSSLGSLGHAVLSDGQFDIDLNHQASSTSWQPESGSPPAVAFSNGLGGINTSPVPGGNLNVTLPPQAEALSHEATSASQTSGPVLAFMGDAGTGFGVLTSGGGAGGSVGGSTSTSSGTLSSISGAGSGLIININWDSSVANAPTGFVSGVESVVQFFESHFSNPISITIDVGYGEVAGVSLPTGDLGASESYLTSVSYSQLETALANNANALGYSAASLPGSSPVSGANYWASTAEAAALGLAGASSSVNGYVGFSSKFNFAYNDSSGVPSGQYDFFGVVAHEITEVMGRTMMDGAIFGSGPGYQPLDLFHYSAPGVHSYVGSTVGYFSADGGKTNLGNFNTNASGDYADWAGSVGHNSFLAFSSSGVVNPVTANDLTEMNLLGWTPSSTSTTPIVTIQLTKDTGTSSTDHITSNPALSGTADANAVITLTEGSTVLGTTTASSTGAWSFTTGLAQGAQTITANETNSAGLTGSASVSFTLDTMAPTVTAQLVQDTGTSSTDHITSNPTVSGTADANAVITLTEGSTVLGTTTASSTGAWSFTPTGLAQGAQTITASETDLAGNTGSTSVSFTLDTMAPSVTAQLAQDTGTSSTDHITSNPALSGTADANAVITLTEGSTVLGTATASSTGAWSFTPTGLAQGAQTITASETDLAGNTGSASVNFTLDTIAPTVTAQLTQDTGATDHITSNPTVSGTADANAVITLTEGSTTLGTTTASSTGAWSFTPTGLAQGAQTITASEPDVAGNTGSASVSFTLDTAAPQAPTITNDTVNTDNTVTLVGTAEATTTITVSDGQTVLGTTTADANGAWSYTTGALQSGAQSFTATATDVAGNTSAMSSAVDPVVGSTQAPTVTITLSSDTGTSSTDHITSNPALSGTADANAVITLTEGSTVLGTTTASSTGAWSFTPTGLAQGAQTITASETNAASNTGSAALAFTLDTTAPVLTAQLATAIMGSASANITADPMISGTADANAAITITEDSTVLGTTTADATGAWSFTPTGLAQGAQTITASETDLAGNVGTASVNFTLRTASNSSGSIGTWTYNPDGSLHELVYQDISGQKWTSSETLYANGKPTAETWANDSAILKTETWNANGSIHDIHYYGVTGQPYSDYDVVYGSNGKPNTATYSNGMTATWTYNSNGSLNELVYQGITGHNWTSSDTLYANGKPLSETWSDNGVTLNTAWTNSSGVTLKTEAWNSDGTIHDIHYYGITRQPYTDYDVIYTNNKPVSAIYSNGMTAAWTYNADGTSEYALNNVQGQSYTSSEKIYDPASPLTSHVAIQESMGTNEIETLHGFENGLTITEGPGGATVTLSSTDSFNFGFHSNMTLTGGGSNENFDFSSGFGNATITDFIPHSQLSTNNDMISFAGGLFSSFADLQQHMTQAGSATVITDGHGDTLTLLHVSMASLHPTDFLL
jgi:Big-like domain-containing protein